MFMHTASPSRFNSVRSRMFIDAATLSDVSAPSERNVFNGQVIQTPRHIPLLQSFGII